MASERMDIVNEDDQVVGSMAIEEIYLKFPRHRVVHIMVFNKKGDIGLQKRSEKKHYKPGYWTTAVSGHPQSGESYEGGAIREGQEELGTKLELSNFRRLDNYIDPDRPQLQRFLGVFEAQHEGPFKFGREEVSDFKFVSAKSLQQMINKGEKIHPELLFILKEVYGFNII